MFQKHLRYPNCCVISILAPVRKYTKEEPNSSWSCRVFSSISPAFSFLSLHVTIFVSRFPFTNPVVVHGRHPLGSLRCLESGARHRSQDVNAAVGGGVEEDGRLLVVERYKNGSSKRYELVFVSELPPHILRIGNPIHFFLLYIFFRQKFSFLPWFVVCFGICSLLLLVWWSLIIFQLKLLEWLQGIGH